VDSTCIFVYFPLPHSTFVNIYIYICEVKKLGQTEISTLKYKYFAKLCKTYKWSDASHGWSDEGFGRSDVGHGWADGWSDAGHRWSDAGFRRHLLDGIGCIQQ
jgi:hypothetical protein